MGYHLHHQQTCGDDFPPFTFVRWVVQSWWWWGIDDDDGDDEGGDDGGGDDVVGDDEDDDDDENHLLLAVRGLLLVPGGPLALQISVIVSIIGVSHRPYQYHHHIIMYPQFHFCS